MPRSITRSGSIFLAVMACLVAGCFSGGYEEDFQARLQEYFLLLVEEVVDLALSS